MYHHSTIHILLSLGETWFFKYKWNIKQKIKFCHHMLVNLII